MAGDEGSWESVSMVRSASDGRDLAGRGLWKSKLKPAEARSDGWVLSSNEGARGEAAAGEPWEEAEPAEAGAGDWAQVSEGRRVRTRGRLNMTSSFSG